MLRVLVYPVFGLVVLATIAYAVLSTEWFRLRLEQQMVQGLQDLTGGQVSISGFSFRPLILQVRITELVVHGSEPASEAPLFSGHHIEVQISPETLLERRLILQRLQWRGATIHLTTSPEGVSNIPGPTVSLLSKETMSEVMDLLIHDLVLPNTDLTWNNQQFPVEVTAKNAGLNLRLSHGVPLRATAKYFGTFACSALSLQAPHWALPPSTFTGQFELARSGLKLSSVVWRSPGLSGQGTMDFNVESEARAEATFHVNGDARELAKYFRLSEIEEGKFQLDGQAKFESGAWASSGRLRAEGVAVKDLPVNPGRVDLSADYIVNAHRAEVPNLALSALGGRITGNVEGTIRDKPEFRSRLRAEGLDLAAALGALPSLRPWRRALRFGGRINGTAESSWNGMFEHLQSKFDFQLSRVPAASARRGFIPVSGSARGTVVLDGEPRLQLARATFVTPHSRLQAQGKLSNSSSDLRFTFSTSDFEEWRPLVESMTGRAGGPVPIHLDSQASVSATFSGPASHRELSGRLEVGEFEISGTHWNGFAGEFSAQARQFQLSDGKLQAGGSSIGVQLQAPLDHWSWPAGQPLTAQVRTQAAELKDLTTALGSSVSAAGPLTGQLDLSGTISEFTGQGSFSIHQGTVGPVHFDPLTSGVQVAPSEIRLENLRLLVGPGSVAGQAGYNISTRVATVSLQGRNFSLAEIKLPGATNHEKPATPAIGGLASFDVQGGGVLPDLKLSANWRVEAFSLQGSNLGNLTGTLNWDANKIHLEGASQGAGGALSLRADAETQGDWPLELSGQFSNLQAGPWIRSLLSGRFNASVTAGGTFGLRGPLARPGELEARSHIEKLNVQVADLAWSNAQPIDATFARQVISISRFQMVGPSTSLEVAGTVKLGHPASLDITANGQEDAKLLDLVDPNLMATGLARLTLHLTGSPLDPQLQGRLDVEGLSLSYGDLPLHVSDLSGPIQLQGDRANIAELRGRSGGGQITLSGFATFAERPRYDLRISLEAVRVRYPFEFTSLLAGRLHLAGTTDGGRLSGEIQVRQMFASPSFNVLTLLSEGTNALAPSPEQLTSPLASNIRLSVDVASAPTVHLETQDLRLSAEVEMRLQGTLANPVDVGAVHILSGEALVRGNRYKLDRGEITMANPLRTDPTLDIEATTRIEHYDLTLDLTGPLERIKIAYRSDPPLAVGDILSLLALGYVHEEGTMSTAQSSQLQSVGASALLSEALSSQMTGRLQRLFGVSRVKVDPNVGGPTNTSGGARVTVEQDVTHNLTVTYITNTATSQERIIQFEWALTDRISLIGIRDQNGIFGLELKLRRRFK